MNDSRPNPDVPAPQPGRLQSRTDDGVVECWKEIGVYGNSQCSSLKEYAHCRHCPVYSAAGAKLLNRPLPAGYRAEWAAHLGLEKGLLEPGNTSAILFRIGSEWLALPTEVLQEVAERRSIHSLPRRGRSPVVGLANVRGELLICVSLGHLIDLAGSTSIEILRTTYARLLVANWDSGRFGFPVDEVSGPCRFHTRELQPPPAPVAKHKLACSQFVVQWEGRSVGLLDPELLSQALNQSLA